MGEDKSDVWKILALNGWIECRGRRKEEIVDLMNVLEELLCQDLVQRRERATYGANNR
jgi:hypothetical protein